jgi:hypothetical protein
MSKKSRVGRSGLLKALKNEEELVLNIIRPDFKKVEKTSFNKEKYMY